MSMSIGQLMKGLIGDAQPGDGKALELKVGQTVRGVLVKMTGDREGIVQINGTPVQAKLDTPLEPGKAVLLQVQPESADGALVLKPADPKTAAIPEASVKEWIKALGLPDTKASADLVGELRKDGVVLTRETAGQFRAALAAMPDGGDARSWMRAAALAFKRGLPMTGATIGALQQVLAGPPAHALLEALEAGLAAWSDPAGGQAAAGSAQPPGAAQAAAAKLQALLAEGAALMREAQQAGGAKPPAGFGGAGAEPAPRGAAGAAAAPGARSSASAQPAAAGAANGVAEGMNSGKLPVDGSASTIGGRQKVSIDHAILPQLSETAATAGASKQAGAPANLSSGQQQVFGEAVSDVGHAPAGRALQQSLARPESVPSRQQSNSAVANDRRNTGSAPQASNLGQPGGSGAARTTAQAGSGTSWVGQMMKWIGVDHERMLATATIQQEAHASSKASATVPHAAEDEQSPHVMKTASEARMPASAGQERAASLLFDRNQQQTTALASIIQDSAAPNGEGTKSSTADTLKSALLTIAASDDVPQQLRDTAQQLVSHITGQQLLLSPEKNGSLFSHVTLFIPMKGPDGSQTASVHIQTRRGRKGELDGDNCRLLFDLRMKTMGETVVDVQVVNKIVNLHVWNDHPASEQLIESSRSELTAALANAGYQLLTLRAEPMPERFMDRFHASERTVATAEDRDWFAKPYKGVDVRV
ncbi:flagellar hook-length control protein FliK [Paenibacillus glycinis]|uniref:Flagellar hook-length control protein FliK n=1 Tax=Paenibacillus glycinis TaxID=2697035 RepID=A0ABW9XIQ2_9BACL|nr:flagellar hook-length control protein FliK [Paenibacillus glycinis]NBD22487.1 hypothetical protein [Paenibacillus glycinis]